MATDAADLKLLEQHDPLIRDAIIRLIGSKTGAQIKSLVSREELRKECEAKVNELLSKGPQLSLAETQGLLDDIEKLGQGQFDPRYFQVMREMIQHSVTTQRLSEELGRIAQSTAP